MAFTKLTASFLRFLDRLHLNFFRIHVIWFIINPLIWSGIFYAANGQYHVAYVDSLFLCVSAMTVTGLSTVNLSTLTGFQQAILFGLMIIGNYTVVSLVMVLVRKHYFVARVLRERPEPVSAKLARLGTRVRSKTMAIFENSQTANGVDPATKRDAEAAEKYPLPQSNGGHDDAPMHIPQDAPLAPSAGGDLANAEKKATPETAESVPRASANQPHNPTVPQNVLGDEALYRTESPSVMSEHGMPPSAGGQVNFAVPLVQTKTREHVRSPLAGRFMSRSGTVVIAPAPGPERRGTGLLFSYSNVASTPTHGSENTAVPPMNTSRTEPGLAISGPTAGSKGPATYEEGFGGFPSPLTIAERLAMKVAPKQYAELKRKLTIDEGGVYAPASTAGRNADPENDAAMVRASSRTSAVAGSRPGHSLHQRRHHHGQPEALTEESGAEIEASTSQPLATPKREPLALPYLYRVADSHTVVPEHLRHRGPHHHNHHTPHSPTATDTSSTGWMTDIHEDIKRTVVYLKQGILKVGRNSAFNTDELSDEQLEELGGVEFRALRALGWIVGLYFVGTQFTMFLIFTIYLSTTSKYDDIFNSQPRLIPKPWFSAFQAVSAYTGGGLTLVDQGMVPFIGAFTLVIFQGWLIVAGSLGLPIFLRLIVWILYHLVPERHKEPLQFLLDHPRRCFLYLFPSHQTWFLVVVFFALTFVEWGGFLLLDIGLPTIEAIPINQRVLAGLFQSIAVRASGFAIVSLVSLAPAVKFLYLVMMYISAYPIAMSIRSTNVYEQRSLGIYQDVETESDDGDPDVDESAAKLVRGGKGEILFSKYLGMHVRRQLSYDLWWLALAMFLICIVERGQIMNPDNEAWFNQFQIMFELVSAYATVGLSLGIPTAIDRAILLPHEFNRIRLNHEGHHIIPEANEDTGEPQLSDERSPMYHDAKDKGDANGLIRQEVITVDSKRPT
ncbi:low affinity potassium transporter [Tulasnella sp. 403]|nr:low affinity potassium transporter [Tulasnella sp. 403]